MSYQKKIFYDGQILTAEDLNYLQDGIPQKISDLENDANYTTLKESAENLCTIIRKEDHLVKNNCVSDMGLSIITKISSLQENASTPSTNNICPILGFSSERLTRSGKNIVNTAFCHGTRGLDGILQRVGYAEGIDNIQCVAWENLIAVVPNKTYYFTSSAGDTHNIRYYFFDRDRNFVSSATINTSNGLTIPENIYWFTIEVPNFSDYAKYIGAKAMVSDEPIEAFESYIGEVFEMNYDLSVCDGLHNWNTGELITNLILYEFDGTETWMAASSVANTYYWDYYTSEDEVLLGKLRPSICSHYPSAVNSTLGAEKTFYNISYTGLRRFFITDSSFSTVNEWKEYLVAQKAAGTPVQVAHEPAITKYQLKPISIKSINGENIVFSNSGKVLVDFNRDTYIPNFESMGVSASTEELNFLSGATSNIQEQLNSKTDTKVTSLNIPPAVMAPYYPICHTLSTDQTDTSRKFDVFRFRTQTGTNSVVGQSAILLGSNIASGNAGNSIGQVILYSDGVGCGYIQQPTTSASLIHNLPISSGTLLNNNDIPIPTVSDKGKILYVDDNGKYRLEKIEVILAQNGITVTTN